MAMGSVLGQYSDEDDIRATSSRMKCLSVRTQTKGLIGKKTVVNLSITASPGLLKSG